MSSSEELTLRWQSLKSHQNHLRIRDAAAQLGVSEAALVSLGCENNTAVRLRPDWKEILSRVHQLGEVMALTRNEVAVHERKGRFELVEFFGPDNSVAQVLGPEIDLRLFLSQWEFCYAVTDHRGDRTLRSLQFFDAFGDAVHKIFLQPDPSELSAFEALVEDFGHPTQSPGEVVKPKMRAPRITQEVDQLSFVRDWDALTDTHEFTSLIKRYGLSRLEGLRRAGSERARELELEGVGLLLQKAANAAVPIMVFVGNRGCIQIHTGPVTNIKAVEGWVNVLDLRFSLHLRQELMGSVWVVRKPTRDGVVTSIEAYDAEGENVALFFGRRKPGQAESPQWRELVTGLEP